MTFKNLSLPAIFALGIASLYLGYPLKRPPPDKARASKAAR